MSDAADEPSSLLDWATGLARDAALRARLAQEPGVVLGEQGLSAIAPVDLHRALPLVTESVAARLGTEVDASAISATPARLGGEKAVHALARQLGAATEVALAPTAGPEPPEQVGGPVPFEVDGSAGSP